MEFRYSLITIASLLYGPYIVRVRSDLVFANEITLEDF